MDEMWDGCPRIEDWAKWVGDQKEVEEMADSLGIALTTARAALETAAAILHDLDEYPVPDDVSEERYSLAGIYLWIAASLGSRRAGFMLADHIRGLVKSTVMREVNAAYYSELADRWEARAEGRPLVQLGWLGSGGPTAADRGIVAENNGHVVVPAIGDPKSPEGLAIAKRYADLIGHPLPYRSSMPPEGVACSIISAEWPWAEHVGRHIEGMLAVQRSVMASRPVLRPMLFVGPPGSGKTALAARVAEIFGVPAMVIPAGGASDAAGLSAVTRGWSSSRPCGPVMAAATHGCCDPAVVIDELDKTATPGSKNGSAAGVLLGLLGNPASFHDSCLLAEVDLSKVFFMATANDLGAIPEALRDRFSVHVVGRPREEHFDVVLSAMRSRRADELGVMKGMLPNLDAEEYHALKDHFSRGGCSLRELSRAYDFILSEAVQRVEAERAMAN